uniref:BTB domain-containing protein n=1 Tax=Tetradesmus obliquus TaxID=3088 RepID=A0A383VMB3_TETOB
MADQAKDTASLLEAMSTKPDISLVFKGDDGTESVPAHATILMLHSPVLAQAVELAPSSSSSSSSSSAAMKELQMPGTSKADFLTVAQFLYPILPLPKVSWDNLEVLLVQGHKWDMQVRPR